MINIKHTLAILAACALAVCCTKIQQAGPSSPHITYELIQSTQTKAATPYSTSGKFYSWAWMLQDGKTWAANKADAQLFIDRSVVSYHTPENAWYSVPDHYWPHSGYNLTFFAASPSDQLGTAVSCTAADGITITDWNVNDNLGVDIMVADIAANKTSGDNQSSGGWAPGVPTIFRHKLSKISGFTFNLQKDYANSHTEGNYQRGDITYLLKSVAIKNMPQKGSYVNALPSESSIGRWDVVAGGVYDYTWYNNGTGELIPYADLKKGETAKSIPANGLGEIQPGVFRSELYLLPQLFKEDGPTLEITYIKRTYTSINRYTSSQTTASISFYDLFTATNHRLVINRDITFNIVFNNEANLITWAPDQQEWGSGDFKIDF